MITSIRALTLFVVLLVATLSPASADTLDLDSATIADLNAAFDRGTLTAERCRCVLRASLPTIGRALPCMR